MKERRMQFAIVVLGVSVFAAFLAAPAAAADWPHWRGTAGDGIYRGDDWSIEAFKGGLDDLWKTNVSSGYSSVAVTGERLYTMGNQDNTDYVGCIDVESGDVVWTFPYPCKPLQYPGPRATPYIDEGRVYTFSSAGHIFCLDAEKGTQIWAVNVAQKMGAKSPKWGFAGSAIIIDDMVIVNAGRHGMAFDKATGESIWSSGAGIAGYATPVLYELDGKRCLAVFGSKAVYGVGLEDGKEIWSYPWETSHDVNAADPIIFDHYCFITSGYNRGATLLDISGAKARKVWETKVLAAQFSSCVLIDGHLYGISGNAGTGELVCLEVMSGEKKWGRDVGFGGLIASDGKLIICNERGTVYIVEATPDSYKELVKTEAFSPGRARIWTAPVLSNGRLYIRSSTGDLACYDVSAQTATSE